ncbi:dethiobiotin synthase [Bowmanella sp. JS7-9]|uniref:ATP-dependent dethiobiotin synthetase BioD n=1 Tax=Pseudobowmanella zhangzhouensis TaxID=1537679 RepID=A0ABW1XK83_9ALTE|nr:dethiobiotin synthase [Bowmanella sp. JS7-9]TBX23046.1 hypothetical protein TK45_07375 [Bowmanella sp. JS7-9]
MRKLFITGTDTEVGKTFISSAIMQSLRQRRLSVVGFKPVAAGGDSNGNPDALELMAQSSLPLTYQQVNPLFVHEAVAPHLAAQKHGMQFGLTPLLTAYSQLTTMQPDVILTEGAGGWRTPLNNDCFLSDLAIAENMDVVLVVSMRLGCLNHARLTAEAIRNDGLRLRGWVANMLDKDMPFVEENIRALERLLNAPRLGTVPNVATPAEALPYLDTVPLL